MRKLDMRKRTRSFVRLGSLITAGALWFGVSAMEAKAVSLVASTIAGTDGATVAISVALTGAPSGTCSKTTTTACTTEADCPPPATGQKAESCVGTIAGTQNDLSFDATNTPIAPSADDPTVPDCTANAAIKKDGTAFSFTSASTIRALVLSLKNVKSIPDGSVLYTCNVNVSATAPDGSYPLTLSGVHLSDPMGASIAGTGTDGAITIGTPPPTPTPSPEVTPTGPFLKVDKVNGIDGATVAITVSLENAPSGTCSKTTTTACTTEADCPPPATGQKAESCTGTIAGTQNDLSFDATNVPIAPSADDPTVPDCTANAAIKKDGTAFSFTSSTAIRALVLSLKNVKSIPSGSVLYSCNVNVSATAADGTYPLAVSGVHLSDPAGASIAGSSIDGAVIVGAVTPTPTVVGNSPTPTPTTQGPPPTPNGPYLIVSTVQTQLGQTVAVTVSLENAPSGTCSKTTTTACTTDADCPPPATGQKAESCSGTIAGTQNDLSFDATNAPIAPSADDPTVPDCTANAAIKKDGTAFSFTSSTAIRALVLSLKNVKTIPSGSVLYTCNVSVPASAGNNAFYPMGISGIHLSDPIGGVIAGSGINGGVVVGIAVTPTPVNTALPSATTTSTSSSSATPTRTTPAGTPLPTSTATATHAATATPAPTTTLSAPISATDTEIPVADISIFPDSGTILIDQEQISYNGKRAAGSSSSFAPASSPVPGFLLNAVRGVNGTTPAAHSAGAKVTLISTAAPSTIEDEGGCQIGAASHSSSGWLLLIPTVGLLVLRRRRR